MQEITATVSGRVQGVMFRNYTQKAAERLELTGFVKNQSDGTVFVRAQGKGSALEELIAALKEGPKFARVDDVSVSWHEPDKTCSDFHIEY